jgi:hypothetical protein
LEGYEGYIPRVTNYYEVLLRLINVEYFPRWGVRALARPTLYRAGQRWPVLNRVALGVVKVMKKAGRIARKS